MGRCFFLVKINLFDTQKSFPLKASFWRKLCKEVAAFEGKEFAEVSLHFVEEEEIGRLHEEFFDDPSPTDCISFPLDTPGDPYCVLGEVFVCPSIAIEVAATRREHPLKELALYVIHGFLHLFGYNDIQVKEKRLMRAAEKRHLANLVEKGFL